MHLKSQSQVPKENLMLDYQNKQESCVELTMTDEKLTLIGEKNAIKVHAKLYESATSQSNNV